MVFWFRLCFVLVWMGAAGASASELRLRLLATTDLHMHLLAHDYYQGRPTAQHGFALTLPLIEQARREAPNHLLFDNGDLLQGSPLGDQVHAQGVGQGHPAYRLLKAVGYDAASLGNHEFNYGLPFLQAATQAAGFPVLSANVVWPDGRGPVFQSSALLNRLFVDERGQRHRLRIGVVGLTPPQIMAWDHQHLAGRVEALDMVSVASEEVAKLKRAGADLVVLLAHTGIDVSGRNGLEHAAQALARIPGVDALVLGHAHAELPGPHYAGVDGVDAQRGLIHGRPAVMPGRWGDHLGLIDLRLERRTRGPWRVAQAQVSLRQVSGVPRALPDVGVAEAHQATVLRMREELAQTTLPLHTYFAQVQDSLAVKLVARAQAWHAQSLLAGTAWATWPLVSASAPFRAGGRQGPNAYTHVPPGPLTRQHVADLYPYPNSLKVLKVTGAELHEWLERSAGQFVQIDPSGPDTQSVLANDHPSYNFDVLDGLDYEIDLTQPRRYDPQGVLVAPSARRVHNLRWQGQPVNDAQGFLLVTNSYRATGGGQFPGTGPDRIVLNTEDDLRDVVARYLQQLGTVRLPEESNWRLRPVPGVHLQLRSAAVAREWVKAPWRWVRDEPGGWALYEMPSVP